ncbi:phage tail family protein [Sporosarcina saromensis]|uniref:Phage tail family protein n=1 Tax=Sporosarcina saromensis TaxID=359365 RepID=A0ABU4G9V2_9BACL|nr:distal tail protein Dit [Sporosarcina saromensis]MDW0113759.1 phage tail family protein [Sporosarcina saromensis]
MANLTFNGVKKDWITVLRKRRPYRSSVSRNLLTIPGFAGGLLESSTVNPLIIPVRIMISGDSEDDYLLKTEELAAWLSTNEPAPLIFDDAPTRTYYALFNGSLDPDEIVSVGFVDVQFVCPDPHKYGPEKSVLLDGTPIVNQGTADTYPITTINIKKDTTFVAIGNGQEVNMIGNYGELNEVPFVRDERIFWDQMGTTVGWGATSTVEGGTIAGIMRTDGYSFFATDYGTGSGWRGPALKKSIGQSVKDFRLDVLLRQIGGQGQVGSVEVMLLDALNRVVAKILMTKRSPHSPAIWARIVAGNEQDGHDIINSRGANDWTWHQFDGMLRIERVGNVWKAYVARYDAEHGWHARLGGEWVDTAGVATANITQVQTQLWAHGTTPPTTTQRIDDIKVFKINDVPDGIPYVARAGDVVEFDHTKNIITLNGEDVTHEKAFIGTYFPINSGANYLTAEPVDAIESATVRWRDKWR